MPSDQTESIDNQLEEVTEYVFQIMQNSNFGQEAHEAFLDLAVGTGCLLVEEGDALNPVRFNAIPLPQLVLENGADDRIDHVYRERKIRNSDILIAYPDAIVSEMLMDKILKEPDNKANMLEVVCRIYDKPNEEQNAYFVICKTQKS